MIPLQDFLIVCNDSKKLQMIQDILTLKIDGWYDSQVPTYPEDQDLRPMRPRSFSFSPRMYGKREMRKMWKAGTVNHNFTGAIFCDLNDKKQSKNIDLIPKLCEEFLVRFPECKVNFHYDLELENSHHFKFKLSTAPNLNLFQTIEPDEIARDLMEQIHPGRTILSGFATYAR